MKKETNISKKRTRTVYTEPLSLGKLYYSSWKEVLPSKDLLKIPFLCLRLHRSMILLICSATRRTTRAISDDLLSDITCLFLYSTCPLSYSSPQNFISSGISSSISPILVGIIFVHLFLIHLSSPDLICYFAVFIHTLGKVLDLYRFPKRAFF